MAKQYSFSPCLGRLAHAGADGVLRVWNTASGVLEHEYQPASHLAASTTCITYSSTKRRKTKKQKQKDDKQDPIIAMGTVSGTILLYSPERQEVLATLEHGSKGVADLAFRDANTLLSLGLDKCLVEWDVVSGKKTACLEVSGSSGVCVLDNNMVVVASSTIQVLTQDPPGKTKVIREFSGHGSQVTQLVGVRAEDNHHKYLLSAAQDETQFCAWDLKKNSSAVGAFMVSEPVRSVVCSAMSQSKVVVAAVTTKGSLVLFNEHLNGNKKAAAVKAHGRLRLVSGKKKAATVPIQAATLTPDAKHVLLAYGNSSLLKFERMSVEDIRGEQVLTRKAMLEAPARDTSLANTVTPNTREATLLGPAHLFTKEKSNKRPLEEGDGDVSELPMEERLNSLVLDTPAPHAVPTTSNLKQLLLQGLHSKDQRILGSVLERGDQGLINNTVRQLPVQAVVPLLEHLQNLVIGKTHKQLSYVLWVRAVLYHHMSHLSTIPNRTQLMQPFFSASAARLSTLAQVTQLHARLDLLLNHVATKHQEAREAEVEPEAMLVYRDESSDDESHLLDDMNGASDPEDNWDALSDFGEMNGHSDSDSDMEVDTQLAAIKRRMDEDSEDSEEVDAKLSAIKRKMDEDSEDSDDEEGGDDLQEGDEDDESESD